MPLALQGRRVVVTRTPEQAESWLASLRAMGADAFSLPTIALAPPETFAPLDAALRQWSNFAGVVFASGNAVQAVWTRAREVGAKLSRGPWTCVVGPATAVAFETAAGHAPEFVAGESRAEGVLASLAPVEVQGLKILLPRAAAGRPQIADGLTARGALVTAVAAYRTVIAEASRLRAEQLFAAPGTVDAVILASPSAARGLADLLGQHYRTRLDATAIVVVGPITRLAAEDLGLTVGAEAAAPNAEAVVDAVQRLEHA